MNESLNAPLPSNGRRLYQLGWPIAVEMLLGISLVWVDSAIINHRLGTEAFTAVQLAGQAFNLLQLTLNIVATGAGIVLAHQVGAGERREAGHTAAQAMTVGLLLSLVLMAVIFVGGPGLLGFLGAKGTVMTGGLTYSRLMLLFLPATWGMFGLGAIMRSTGDTKRPMYANVLVNIFNAAFTWTLVFPLNMGIAGSAIGTGLARVIGFGLMLYVFLRSRPLPMRLPSFLRLDLEAIYRIGRMGLPAALEFISYEASQFVLTAIVAPLGTIALAARALSFQAEFFSYIPMIGLEQAVAILVGQKIGAGRREEAVAAGRTAIKVALALVAALMIPLILLPGSILRIFTTDTAVLAQAAIAVRIMAFYKPGQCINVVCGGIFRGAGNPEWPTVLTTLGTWILTVPLAFIAIRLGYGLPGIVGAMLIDELLRGGINLWYFTTSRWRFRTV
jgi:putative MATE family efflux protein